MLFASGKFKKNKVLELILIFIKNYYDGGKIKSFQTPIRNHG